MHETKAMAIRLEGLPHGPIETMTFNEISSDYKSVLDNERVALLVLPRDIADVRIRLEEAGFAVAGVDTVSLTDDEAWFLRESEEDVFDGFEDDDGEALDLDFDMLDDGDMDGYGAGQRF